MALSLCLPGSLSKIHAASIAAQWDFNDPANGATSVASTGGYEAKGIIITPLTRTSDAAGVSGRPGDYGLSVGILAGMTPTSPGFFTTLNALAGSQALSFTYWFRGALEHGHLVVTSPSTFAGHGLGVAMLGGPPGLALVFDTSGCCDPTQRLSAPFNSSEVVPSDTWHFLAFVYDHGAKQIYFDSALRVSGAGSLPLVTDFTALQLGGGFGGVVDNFTLWNGTLTSAEIATLAVRPVPEPTVPLLIGLAGVAMRRRRAVG